MPKHLNKIKRIPIDLYTLRVEDYDNELTLTFDFPNDNYVLYHCLINIYTGEKEIIKICNCQMKENLNQIISYEFQKRNGYKPTFKYGNIYKTVFHPYTDKNTEISCDKEEFIVFIDHSNFEIYTFKEEKTRTY